MTDPAAHNGGKLSRAGRPTKRGNKLSGTVKDAFREAFELLGGAEGLARWAREHYTVKGRKVRPNLEAFYTLATKLIPAESITSGTVQTDHRHYVAVEHRDALPAPAIPADQVGRIPGPRDQVTEAEIVPQVIDFIG